MAICQTCLRTVGIPQPADIGGRRPVAEWLRNYATNRKVVGSRPYYMREAPGSGVVEELCYKPKGPVFQTLLHEGGTP
jgi:hypothetical protein